MCSIEKRKIKEVSRMNLVEIIDNMYAANAEEIAEAKGIN